MEIETRLAQDDGQDEAEGRDDAYETTGVHGDTDAETVERSVSFTGPADRVRAADDRGPSAEGSVPEDPDMELLEEELNRIARSHTGTYGVAVFDPVSGEGVGINEDKTFDAASVGKLPVLATLYSDVAAGRVSLDEDIYMLPSDVQYGTGVLHRRPPGTPITLRECAYYLIHDSDNTAWTMLYRELGLGNVRDELTQLGAKSSYYDDYGRLFTSAEDTLGILKRLQDPEYTDPKLSSEMLSFMTDTAYEGRLPQPLPQDGSVRVAHKVGSNSSSLADAGMVFYQRPESETSGDTARVDHYYIVVFASGTSESEATDAIREMSYATFQSIR